MIGFLTLFLLIPLFLVRNLIEERAERQLSVVNEINSKWGKDVFLYGPILKIPYTAYKENEVYDQTTKKIIIQRESFQNYAYFFPELLKNSSQVTTETKKRNNYESVVFSTQMDFVGKYLKPDFSSKNISNKDIQWNKATILIRTTNLSSIKNEVSINLAGKNYTFEPIYDNQSTAESYDGSYYQTDISSLETSFIDLTAFEEGDFSFSIMYDGSSKIGIVPIGKVTESTMQSNWKSPSFTGSFLPYQKEITNNGFSANWKILHINRPFSQQSFEVLPNIRQYAFEVDFVIPVDEYQQNERASKYGFLVIGLTFLIFFLIQTISKIKIHIFQYTMIGLSLVMFYTLLISITEHSSFLKAYLIASLLVVSLISLYSISILKNKKFPLFIGLSLLALYGFIFVIIQLESYALLVGSLGLFAILAIVMYASRKIDWGN
ncbi:cell envelope integrity protein CreD [Capnocytophaga catalasegens]|uniref:Cell envelope integrity protein CreD n=2 Tax=Capnocytophaga catalasegens TaxID=1004260 RepID=A0AAV5AUR6_9FLAO|nr:cell envelope integrity protein CreD [Capnocytophaga catalasegens]GJM51011.1 cell envelope integrity protein CreD [Capnocytophaga catalasegens]GJM52196.1 cell envelope integrity protein CreD [Capnocytophaga catalasegens]